MNPVDGNVSGDSPQDKHSALFLRLVFMFQTAALQQMGKLVDPITGKTRRDLEQAAVSIDTLDMLRARCRGNLAPDEERLLNHVIAELQLNYVDEVGRAPQAEAEEKGAETSPPPG